MPGGGVAVTVEATAAVPPERAFAAIAPVDLRAIFTGYGPLPAVRGTRDQAGGWDRVGATRTVELADGSSARERLTAYEPPGFFAYRLDGFTGAVHRLVDHVDGAWWFSPRSGGATAIRWAYTFHPCARTRPLLRAVVAPLWRGYARRVVALAAREAERAASP